jgi:3-(3-hydroxy-phenyl)propionate hydroxylase
MKPFDVPLYPYARQVDQDAAAAIRYPVIIVGAGPVGLALAIDLAQRGIAVVVLDDNEKVSRGSRAICFAKRTLEIFDRLGIGDVLVAKGVGWNLGKVYFDERQVFEFNMLPEAGHKRPAFINLQQYYLEQHLVARVRTLAAEGKPISLRGGNRVTAVTPRSDGVVIDIATPDGPYQLEADYLAACDGAGSAVRTMLGLDFQGRVFEDNFLIADVVMPDGKFPVERRFWFDPPFNRGQSALLHKQPDKVWRIDLQLGQGIDKAEESRPERVIPRIKAFLGQDAEFTLDWVSIYTFQCRRMERFRHGRIVFCGDSAHQVSPFGARGANSGVQDADNLGWKLAAVLSGDGSDALLDSYDAERGRAADENIRHSSRSTDFITPKSEVSRLFRDAVLDLAEVVPATRPLVNSGRLSTPTVYDGSPLNGPDVDAMPRRTRPGSVICDVALRDGWLVDQLEGTFVLLAIDTNVPDSLEGLWLRQLRLSSQRDSADGLLAERYLGDARSAVYLIRPDHHIAARWETVDSSAVSAALRLARGCAI